MKSGVSTSIAPTGLSDYPRRGTDRGSESLSGLCGTDHRIGSIPDQLSGSARSSGSKRIFEVVYFAVLFRGRAVTGE